MNSENDKIKQGMESDSNKGNFRERGDNQNEDKIEETEGRYWRQVQGASGSENAEEGRVRDPRIEKEGD